MKKVIMVLFLVTVIFGLVACGGAAEYQDSPLPTATEQGAEEISDGNADTNIDPNVVQGTHTQTPPLGEVIAGTLEAIDGMSLTIDTTSVFVSSGTESYQTHIFSGEPLEPQQEIIRLTEQTTIEVQTTINGQITGSEIGTLDNLSLGIAVMAEGEWQDGEFVATTLTIMNF